MSEKAAPQPIDLPGLQASQINTVGADVHVGAAPAGVEHPQLVLEGGEDAFSHTFEDGRLTLREQNQHGVTTSIGGGGNVHVFGGQYASNIITGSVTISGDQIHLGPGASVIIGGDIQASARRRASLLLPAGHEASHDISTTGGDVELDGLTARVMKLASKGGDLSLRNTVADSVALKTMGSDVSLTDVVSTSRVSAGSMGGDIRVTGGEAPAWDLKTMGGDVTASGVTGNVNAKSMGGSTRIS